MTTPTSSVENQVKEYCSKLATDPLLVQGAGGNVSWKDDDLLWVKASGMWLAEAKTKSIFVPIKLPHLRNAISRNDFSVEPQIVCNSGSRPSIETLLHALMPHRVVVHLHVVEVLARLVRVDARQLIENLIGDGIKWIFVDYFKPGADLARAISEELKKRPTADVVFMGNHGLVIGGASVDEVSIMLSTLIKKLKTNSIAPEPESHLAARQSDFFTRGYIPCSDMEINSLAIKGNLISRIRNDWALYPDHVVFLGTKPVILEKNFKINDLDERVRTKPPFIFALGEGVYESLSASPAQKSQLRCYFDVITRLHREDRLRKLENLQVSELINWDAENYRRFFV